MQFRFLQSPDGDSAVVRGLLILAAAVIGFGGYQYYVLATKLAETEQHLATTTAELARATEHAEALQGENLALSEALYSEQQKNAEFETQIEEIAETVGTLDKLSRTDPELLQKYSRVYFLNEHYRPPELVEIPAQFRHPEDDDEFIHPEVWPRLRSLLEKAARDGIVLRVISAFRTFDEQSELKTQYDVVYGAGTANQFSAAQGYSEHQLGTTVDFTTEALGAAYANLAATDAYEWLLEEAHNYGFVLSYPEDNAYYQFEPWHWRYVGVELARRLNREGRHFYDMDQREIDTYLVKIFD